MQTQDLTQTFLKYFNDPNDLNLPVYLSWYDDIDGLFYVSPVRGCWHDMQCDGYSVAVVHDGRNKRDMARKPLTLYQLWKRLLDPKMARKDLYFGFLSDIRGLDTDYLLYKPTGYMRIEDGRDEFLCLSIDEGEGDDGGGEDLPIGF